MERATSLRKARQIFGYSHTRMRRVGRFFHAHGLCRTPSPTQALEVVADMVRYGCVPLGIRRFIRTA